MTKNATARNGDCTPNISHNNFRNYSPPAPDGSYPYRLWHSDVIVPDKPNTILVHGAPALRLEPELNGIKCVPMPGHLRDRPNNYFCRLGPLLHNELYGGHNIWEFEYADQPVTDPLTNSPFEDPATHEILYFNFGDLRDYGIRLAQAVDIVRKCNSTGDVNIIAHSMGGLVARSAVQNGTVNKLVTLDTGHYGFNLAGFFDRVMQNLPDYIRHNAPCVHQTAPGNKFLNDLNGSFRHCRVMPLSSLAANNAFPRPIGRIVEFSSAHLGEDSPGGTIRYDDHCTPFNVVQDVDHLSIIQIYNESHPAFCKIVEALGHNC